MARSRGPAGSIRTLAILLFFLASQIAAQNNNNNNDDKTTSTTAASSAATTSSAAATVGTTNLPNLSEASSTSTQASSSSARTSSSTSAAAVSVTSAPALTTTTGSLSVFHLTGLPTLAGAGIPTVGVPNTQNAPFMQKSNLPEGTVFIIVGAFLGALGAAVLAWRGLVAWSLHRSVKRAALNQGQMDNKALLRGGGPPKGVYSHVGASSTLSLDHLNSPNPARASKYQSGVPSVNSRHGPQPSSTNLFFSPTAGTGLHASNRSSSYLPAGYYAPGASAPAAGAPMTHIGGPPGPLSMGPTAAGYTRTHSLGPSPPSSPGLPPSRGNESMAGGYPRNSVAGNGGGAGLYSQQQSVSSLNLSAPPHQGRTPSAYLEDLFENHGNGPRERF